MKVNFNIKKLQFAPITEISDAGTPTYGTPLKLPGTVSLSMDSSQSSDVFYADGTAYYSPAGATSYTGTLENALFTAEVLKAIYKYIEDTNGNLLETDEAPVEFALQFACDSDDGEVYFTYYRVSSNKPGLSLNTSAASATINPQSVSLTANAITLADGETKIVKGFATKSASNYATYFESVTIPTKKSV